MVKRAKFDYYQHPTILRKYGLAVDNVGLWKSEIHFIEKYFPKKSKILDLGCGSGRTTINMFLMGYQNIIGVDLSNEMIEQCQNICFDKNLQIAFEQGDATNLINFQDQEFDHILFSFNGFTAIPSVKMRLKALQEIKRVLKPGGYYIFTAHNREQSNFAWHWEEEKKRWENGKANPDFEVFGDHYIKTDQGLVDFIHIYSIDEIKKELTNIGFKIIEIIDRNQNFNENGIVHQFSSNTIFYVVQKPSKK